MSFKILHFEHVALPLRRRFLIGTLRRDDGDGIFHKKDWVEYGSRPDINKHYAGNFLQKRREKMASLREVRDQLLFAHSSNMKEDEDRICVLMGIK